MPKPSGDRRHERPGARRPGADRQRSPPEEPPGGGGGGGGGGVAVVVAAVAAVVGRGGSGGGGGGYGGGGGGGGGGRGRMSWTENRREGRTLSMCVRLSSGFHLLRVFARSYVISAHRSVLQR